MIPAVPNAFHLRELHQIATYEERRALDERCLQIKEEAAKHRARRTELRERELAFCKSLASSPQPHRPASSHPDQKNQHALSNNPA